MAGTSVSGFPDAQPVTGLPATSLVASLTWVLHAYLSDSQRPQTGGRVKLENVVLSNPVSSRRFRVRNRSCGKEPLDARHDAVIHEVPVEVGVSGYDHINAATSQKLL